MVLAFEAMLGYAIGACLGRTAEDMIHADDHALVMLRFDQLMRGDIRPTPVPSDGAPARATQPPPSTSRSRDDDRSRNP